MFLFLRLHNDTVIFKVILHQFWNTAVPLLSYSCMFQVEICFQQLEICKSVHVIIMNLLTQKKLEHKNEKTLSNVKNVEK
jgi:hypothetical protein